MKKPGLKYLLLVIVFLLTIGYFVASSVRHSRLTNETAAQVKLVLDRMIVYENIYDDMQDYETAYRGYAITRNRAYLGPIERHEREIPNDITRLRRVLLQEGISSEEKENIRHLDSLVSLKITHGERIIDMVSRGKYEETVRRISSGYGKALMDSIKGKVLLLEDVGRHKLLEANSRNTAAAASTKNDYLLSGFVGFTLIGLLLFFLYREERKRILLGQEAMHLAMMVDQSNEAIFSIGTDSRIKSWNKGAEQVYGLSRGEAVGRKVMDVIQPVLTMEELHQISNQLNASGHWEGELTHNRQDGQQIRVISSTNILQDDQGRKNGYVAHTKDITLIKELEGELQRINSNLTNQVAEKTSEILEIFERVTDGFLAVDSAWNITFLSTNGAMLLGVDKGDSLHRNFWELVPVGTAGDFVSSCEQALVRQQPVEAEAFFAPAGTWHLYRIYPSANGLSIFFKDITSEKNVQRELQESEQRFRVLVENSRNLIAQFDEKLEMTYINPAGASLLEIPDPARPEIPFMIRKQLDSALHHLIEHGVPKEQLVSWKKEARTSHLLVRVALVSGKENGMKSAILVGHDITQEIENANQLRTSRDELRKLTNYLEKVREEERTRIARDIHDHLGQQLTGLKLDINWIRKKLNGGDPLLEEKILEINKHLDETVRTVRNISAELRPLLLDDLGLVPAIEHYCEEFSTRSGIRYRLDYDAGFPSLSNSQNSNLFRIFQEALTNVMRHAQAKLIDVSLGIEQDRIHLVIQDDGIGFDHNRASETLGLIGMKERAISLGGHLDLITSPGKGTSVRVVVPLSPATDA